MTRRYLTADEVSALPAEKTGDVWQVLGRDVSRLRPRHEDTPPAKFGYWLALTLVQSCGGRFFIVEDTHEQP